MKPDINQLRDILLTHGQNIRNEYHFPWIDQKPLDIRSANKFFLGSILNYQMRANTAWNNARKLAEDHFGDPENIWQKIINQYSEREWESLHKKLSLHRFPAGHNRVWRIANDLVKKYDGDVRNIWQGHDSSEVRTSLNKMRCGSAISDMIVMCLINEKLISGTGDVKPDLHVRRVLGRIFYEDLTANRARELAREIYPQNPSELDVALYDIGRNNCTKELLFCDDCPAQKVCLTANQD